MAAKDLGPLDWKAPIVDSQGRPSPEFQRRWNLQRNNNALIGTITFGVGAPTGTPADGAEYVNTATTPYSVYLGNGGAWHHAGVVVFTDLGDAPHAYAGHALALVRVKSTVDGVEFVTQSAQLDTLGAPATGQLLQRGASTWALVTLSTVLDGISSTRGTVLYRGAAGWSALAPGVAGNVLSTGGAGADPSWIAPGGGGGGAGSAFKGYPPALVALTSAPGLDLWHGVSIIIDETCSLTSLMFIAIAAVPTVTIQAAIYADNGMKVDGGALIASSAVVTGVTQGINTITFTAPLAVTKGQVIWAGLINHVASVTFAAGIVANDVFINAPVGAPPNPAGTSSIGASIATWLSK